MHTCRIDRDQLITEWHLHKLATIYRIIMHAHVFNLLTLPMPLSCYTGSFWNFDGLDCVVRPCMAWGRLSLS
jgi:hypothetical protein